MTDFRALSKKAFNRKSECCGTMTKTVIDIKKQEMVSECGNCQKTTSEDGRGLKNSKQLNRLYQAFEVIQ